MAKWRYTEGIVDAVKDLVSESDLKHIRRILTSGCPADFNWEESSGNKDTFVRRDNNPWIETSIL